MDIDSLDIVAKIFGTNAGCVNMVDVPLQLGVTDCSLFVVAYMTSLAFGENPNDVRYNQEVLRSHLVSCFSNKKLTLFPSCIIPHEDAA